MAKGHRSQIKQKRNEENREKRPMASHKYARVSSTKAKIVLDQIKGKDIATAKGLLLYCPRYAAELISKVLNSAVANAENNLGFDRENLFIEEAFANQGPTIRRMRARSHGRADRIEKKTSHISIILNEK